MQPQPLWVHKLSCRYVDMILWYDCHKNPTGLLLDGSDCFIKPKSDVFFLQHPRLKLIASGLCVVMQLFPTSAANILSSTPYFFIYIIFFLRMPDCVGLRWFDDPSAPVVPNSAPHASAGLVRYGLAASSGMDRALEILLQRYHLPIRPIMA